MDRTMMLLLAPVSALTLSGCVAGLAASAAGMAIRAAQGKPQSNAHLQAAARTACSENASSHGTVEIIDIVQRSVDRIVVWGTVEDANQRRSFECGFGTKIIYFKLRDIRTSG